MEMTQTQEKSLWCYLILMGDYKTWLISTGRPDPENFNSSVKTDTTEVTHLL